MRAKEERAVLKSNAASREERAVAQQHRIDGTPDARGRRLLRVAMLELGGNPFLGLFRCRYPRGLPNPLPITAPFRRGKRQPREALMPRRYGRFGQL